MFPKGDQEPRYAAMFAALELQARMLKSKRRTKASPMERIARTVREIRRSGLEAFLARRERRRMVDKLKLDAPLPRRADEPTPPKGHLAPLMRPTKFPEIPVSLERNTEVFPAPPPLSPFSPPDLDRRVDSPALSVRGSRPSGRTSG